MSQPLSALTKGRKTLPLESIRLDGDTQIRCKLDSSTVAASAEAFSMGHALPPVTVFFEQNDYWLADGFHRFEARRLDSHKDIDVEIVAFVAHGSNKNLVSELVPGRRKGEVAA